MNDTIIIRETFSNRDDAEEARERLEYGGFARNSMNIMRMGDQFELAIHTRPENRQRVQDCIDASDVMFEARRYGRAISEHAPSVGQSILLLGGLAATAVALFYAFGRNRQRWSDRGGVDRRWDRPDRLVDTRQEDRRWSEDPGSRGGQRFADRSPGLRSDAAGYGA